MLVETTHLTQVEYYISLAYPCLSTKGGWLCHRDVSHLAASDQLILWLRESVHASWLAIGCRWDDWRCCLGALLLQAKPCRPRASTALPHTHCFSWSCVGITNRESCGKPAQPICFYTGVTRLDNISHYCWDRYLDYRQAQRQDGGTDRV